jgi:hypothetical protein
LYLSSATARSQEQKTSTTTPGSAGRYSTGSSLALASYWSSCTCSTQALTGYSCISSFGRSYISLLSVLGGTCPDRRNPPGDLPGQRISSRKGSVTQSSGLGTRSTVRQSLLPDAFRFVCDPDSKPTNCTEPSVCQVGARTARATGTWSPRASGTARRSQDASVRSAVQRSGDAHRLKNSVQSGRGRQIA